MFFFKNYVVFTKGCSTKLLKKDFVIVNINCHILGCKYHDITSFCLPLVFEVTISKAL